jgi:hypothetical protein
MMAYDDYRFGEEARERDLKIVWKCSKCGREYEDYPGINEGGLCLCGGQYEEAGETFTA